MKVKNTISNEGDKACKDISLLHFSNFFFGTGSTFFCKLMVPALTIDDAGVQILKGNKIWFIFESK